MLGHLLAGLGGAAQPYNLLALAVGVAIGIAGGAMPGLNAGVMLALMLPLTFTMPPETSIILLTAVYVGAEYGGSISAILINTPGTPSAVVTVLDGYALNKAGYPKKALCASLIPGAVGGIFANIVLIAAAVPLSSFALHFGPAEFFALGILGITLIAGLTGGDWVKGLLAAALGLFVGTIGTDPITGFPRFAFGSSDLRQGIQIVPALIGLLALSEAFVLIDEHGGRAKVKAVISRAYPTLAEWKRMTMPTLRGSAIGTLVGAIPGAGGTIASLIAYNEERRSSKHPEKFGTGVIEGIAAPESANNAVIGGSLIPTLTLGIPGSVSAAVLIGALAIHGIQPGPDLFSGGHANVVYDVLLSQFFANFAMVGLGLLGMAWWMRVAELNKMVLACMIVALVFIGAYASDGNVFDVVVAVVLGFVGYAMRRIGMPVAPFVLALVLAFLLESNFRRLLLLSSGDYLFIFSQPIADVILGLALASVVLTVIRERSARRRSRSAAGSIASAADHDAAV